MFLFWIFTTIQYFLDDRLTDQKRSIEVQIGLKEETEQQAQHVEKAADRILKGAALISLAGLIIAKSLGAVQHMNLAGGLVTFCAGIIAGLFLVVTASPLLTLGVSAFDPTDRVQNLKPAVQAVFGLIFAGVLTVLIAGLFYADLAALAAARDVSSPIGQVTN
jgi:hypothetical protein